MSEQGILQEKVRVLDKSRSGYLAVITRLCNEIDKNASENIVYLKELEFRLHGAFERYKECCGNYKELLHDTSEKYLSVQAQYNSQQQRVRLYVKKINLLVTNAVELEMTKLEIEIRQREIELQRTIKLSNMQSVNVETVGHSQTSRSWPMNDSTKDQEHKQAEKCDFQSQEHAVCTEESLDDIIIPPPLMFSDFETPKVKDIVNPQKTSTPVGPPLRNVDFTIPVIPEMDAPQESQAQAEGLKVCKPQETQSQVKELERSTPQEIHLQTDDFESFSQQESLSKLKEFHGSRHNEAEPQTNECKTEPQSLSTSPPPTKSSSIVETLVASMEKMSVAHDLPTVQVIKFDGAPEKYPAFRLRFKQLVESRPLEDTIKMTRLLQFLEGSALAAVQRYETIPGGLDKALKILEDRFGRPYHVVRACVDCMTKGPTITPNDRQALQRFADNVQVNYDTLAAMGYLAEMNTDNLEKMLSRLPKWIQAKFVEHLNQLERKGQTIPSFKDVVEFLRDRADIVNHPFLSRPPTESAPTMTKLTKPKSVYKATSFATATTAINAETCPLCSKPHRLYHCDAFKAKSPRERGNLVKEKRLCFNCFSSKHHAKQCKSTTRCRNAGCGKLHHTMLHLRYNEKKPEKSDEATSSMSNEITAGSYTVSSSCDVKTTSKTEDGEVLLQVIPLRVTSLSGDSVTTYGLLDSGSDITMIDPSLALLLGMKGTPSRLSISTVNDTGIQENGLKVDFKLSSMEDAGTREYVFIRSAWAIKDLAIPLKHTEVLKAVDLWPHLTQVPFPEVERKKISVLIGTNIQEAFVPLEVRKGKRDEPFAIRSCIGWSVLGGTFKGIHNQTANLNSICSEDLTLSHQLEEFWKVESYGAEKQDVKPMSVEDRRAMKIIDDTLCREGNHYKMGLLWKEATPHLPYNRQLAEARLNHLKVRLKRDTELFAKYKRVMDDYIARGYATKLTKEEAEKVTEKTWYLPHHPVSNINKPGKIRVVFDAAAKFNGTSLNDQLLQGPSLINDLCGVLLRFREELFAFTADVEAMFYQVKVIADDTDALRFLWWPSDNLDYSPEEYKMSVHIFGAKSSPCCANKALRVTAQDNESNYDPEVVYTVQRNFYVDDVLKSASSREKAIHLATELVKLLHEGGFHLSKFTSNSREVLASLPVEDRADPKLDMDLNRLPIGRAFGVYWDAESDMFGFKTLSTNKPPSKRGILSIVSSLFDPLGFLSPLALPVKILLQDLWRAEISWDEEIPEPYMSQWKEWLREMPQVVNIQIPRCFKSSQLDTLSFIQLHVFSDASRRGLAAVAYLRMLDQHEDIHCSFVMGKAKNSPLKEWTIPRLELQAAVLATRLSKTIVTELDYPISSITFWTDSLTTLQYIRNKSRRFPVFVANRITEIHETTSSEQWRHVPGVHNPADEGSRGASIDYFKDGCRWWSGPDFLWQTDDHWPSEEPKLQQELDSETGVTATTTVTTTTGSQIDLLLRRYSSWSHLLRVMSWLLRFIKAFRGKPCHPRALTLKEIQDASREIIRLVQRESFQEEYRALQGKKQVKRSSKLSSLDPVLVDGVIRVGGRVRNAPLPVDAVHPMILPKDHPISELVVRYYHKLLGHAGREHVLSTIRQQYWIVKGRALVRHVLHKCLECRKRNASTMQQVMGDLPKERLTPFQAPFTFIGIDFFGPSYVKRGRATEKVYGCIFVCFNTRAVHIEDASSLSTDIFIQAFRRFIAVRGCPKEVWSDNGTNFTGAEKELGNSIKQFNEDVIRKELHSKGTEWYSCPMPKWKFQPPAASHMSGVWERLIKSVRKTMKPLVGNPNAPLALETLRTVFCEAVSILNSRPLCPSSDDPNDLEPLTPKHFLLLRPNVTPPPGIFSKDDLYSRKHWRHAQFLSNHFWTRWIKEYIPMLQQRQKWTTVRRDLKVNDLVLVTDSTEPRCRWLLGRVTKVFPGKDNHVRSAEVKTKGSTLVRPITKLCLLEESS